MISAAMEASPQRGEAKKISKRNELSNNRLRHGRRVKLSTLTLFNFHVLGFHQLYQVESASLTRIVLSLPILGEITGKV